MNRSIFLLSILSISLLTGCETLQNTWSGTKTFYRSYLNTPATIDYEETGSLEDVEKLMVLQTRDIFTQLSELERKMENMDRGPTPESLEALTRAFPWLDGVVMIDKDGAILAQEPADPMKQLDYSPLLQQKNERLDNRALRTLVQDTPLGPEIMLGVPVFRDAELAGIFIVHFDPRALVRMVPDPGKLIIRSPELILWTGRYAIDSTPMAGDDWKKEATKNISGHADNKTGTFYWLAKIFGNEPLIFAVPEKGTFPENTTALDGLTN